MVQERVQEEEETAHAVSMFMNRKEQKLSLDRSTESTFEASIVASSVEGNIFSRKKLCRAYGKVGHKCSKKGHFWSVCRTHEEVSRVQVEDVQVV